MSSIKDMDANLRLAQAHLAVVLSVRAHAENLVPAMNMGSVATQIQAGRNDTELKSRLEEVSAEFGDSPLGIAAATAFVYESSEHHFQAAVRVVAKEASVDTMAELVDLRGLRIATVAAVAPRPADRDPNKPVTKYFEDRSTTESGFGSQEQARHIMLGCQAWGAIPPSDQFAGWTEVPWPNLESVHNPDTGLNEVIVLNRDLMTSSFIQALRLVSEHSGFVKPSARPQTFDAFEVPEVSEAVRTHVQSVEVPDL